MNYFNIVSLKNKIKFYFLTSGFCFLALTTLSQPALQWQKHYGGSQDDQVADFNNYYDGPDHCITLTTDGGFAFVGYSRSNDYDLTGNHGSNDYMIYRCDASGNILWNKLIGGGGDDQATSIVSTSDGGFAICGFSTSNDGDMLNNKGNYDVVIVKLDSLGNILWTKNYGGSSEDRAYSFSETAGGGFIVAATTQSNDYDLTLNLGWYDIWVFKVDNLGNLIWSNVYGGASFDWANSIQLTSDQGAIVGGFTYSIDTTIIGQHGGSDYFVFKIDSNGVEIWNKAFGGAGNDWGTGITTTSDGGYAMIGLSESFDGDVTGHHGLRDSWVVKMTSTGSIEWQNSIGGSLYEDGYDLFEAADGNLIIGGTSMSNDGDCVGNYGWWDYSLTKLNMLDGSKIWQKSFGGSSADYAISVIPDGAGSYLMAGNSKSSDYNIANYGMWDLWIAKLTDDHNEMSGHFFVDNNSDGVFSTGDLPISNKLVSDSIHNLFVYTDSTGYFKLQAADTGTYTFVPTSLNYYSISPSSNSSSFLGMNLADTAKDFIASAVPGIVDLSVSIIATSRFRPGFPSSYLVGYENIGTAADTATLILVLDNSLYFDSSSVVPDYISGDTLIWYNLYCYPWIQGLISVYTNCNPFALIGQNVSTTATITTSSFVVDSNLLNNTALWETDYTGSFDPNDKAVSLSKIYEDQLTNIPYLDYVIQFQNTGNDTAFNVVVRDTLSSLLDANSFELKESNYPVSVSYDSQIRLLTFTFSNILLADSTTNSTASHGIIHFRIKPSSTIHVGDQIENIARIYFDFNQPIITNTASTSIILENKIPPIDGLVASIHPNPSSNSIRLSFQGIEKANHKHIEVFNILGELVLTKNEMLFSPYLELSIATLPAGVYLIKISTEKNIVTGKFIKQ